MSRLFMTKPIEAHHIAAIWNMGCESLDPENYENLERALMQMCKTRGISNVILADEQRCFSQKRVHSSDCETSNAPAYVAGVCDCGA